MQRTTTGKLALSPTEAARLLGIGRNSIYSAVARGDIPTIRLGGRILIPKHRLLQMLEEAKPS